MDNYLNNKTELNQNGFSIIENIYSNDEIVSIISTIEEADSANETFRKSNDLFAIRQFLKEVPCTINLIFNDNLKRVIKNVFGEGFFVVKSIYFDKPSTSNWYVTYHQDLTISVDNKIELDGFGSWTTKQNQYAVQPPIEYLENISTIRIHLDDTNEENGALRIIKHSHKNELHQAIAIDTENKTEIICPVKKGGIMLMKPLIMHSSSRTTNNKRRRVIHIEFSSKELPEGLKWAEHLEIN